MKLNVILKDIDSKHLLEDVTETRYLPTQRVVSEPKFIVPTQAKAWRLYLFVIDGKVLDYHTLLKTTDDFRGTAQFEANQLWLTEYWEDQGSDGHTNYRHRGWSYSVGAPAFDADLDYERE
jgi:hypothetical protein